MYNEKQILCFILARGGSKGVPRKNIKQLYGKPLIAHSIDVAKKSHYIDKIYVSTEDEEIKKISIFNGANVIDRPQELATDESNYLDAVKHMLDTISEVKENPIIILLETTSPIRKSVYLDDCIKLLDENTDCVASISEVKVQPVYMFKENNGYLEKFEKSLKVNNRQQMEKLFNYNGSILVSTVNFLKNQEEAVFGGRLKGYLLDEKHSVDIDSPLDFQICEFLLKNSND
jgi:N-acylneuraminate cytidylyltransferase/CMP-N,N'-diacetyllegionaminic acid synthase